ncbi:MULTISPECIES: Xaa-Pro peptidase family protein [unclassified Mesorhizobium]|uniref:M24 family metallopeptidase n=1 Tax=unclassified Mesorhizobium TaxID=325217 RepID=UPI0015E44845|nr:MULTISPECIES: Xaa-Pro peptidase family protein [unclassified Mesorhizobium]
MRAKFAAFTQAEHRTRLQRVRALMKARGIDYAISMAPESLYYYGGYDSWVSVNSPQALIFTADDDEPTIVLRDTDLSLAYESTWVRDIRPYRLMFDNVSQTIASVAREKGLSGGKVAIETQTYALPHALGLALADALAPAEIVDATAMMGLPRLIKSPAELAYLREAAGHARSGLEAMRRTLRPGMSEIALAAEIENAVRVSGSDYWSIPTELAGGERSAGGHATPRARLIAKGDLVHAEFAGVSARYHATAIHTMAAGEPDQRARAVYEVARRSLAAGTAAIAPGAHVGDIEEASLEPVRAAGMENAAVMRFGYGIGVAYPPIWLEPLQISRGPDQRLENGMVFVLHAYLQFPDEGLGVILGGTYALTETGVEMLVGSGDAPLEVA